MGLLRINERYLAFPPAVPQAFLEVSDLRSQFLIHYLLVYRVVQGGTLKGGICATRITVTLSIFIFSTRFFAQIVENRETQLSSLFLGPGGNFSKSYDENRFVWQLYGS
jgi:hypothetical protein